MTSKQRPPKLVHLKYTSPLQTVNLLHSGVARCCQLGTSPRACGWEAYLPQSLNRRSGARHQPLPYWQFLGMTPYAYHRTSAPFLLKKFLGKGKGKPFLSKKGFPIKTISYFCSSINLRMLLAFSINFTSPPTSTTSVGVIFTPSFLARSGFSVASTCSYP